MRLAQGFDAELCLLSSTVGGHIESLEAYLNAAVTGLSDFHDLDGDTLVLPRGATTAVARLVWPAPAIIASLEGTMDSAVCMATHGRGWFGRLALGSVADEVVGDACAPVVLVGPEATLTAVKGRRMVLCWEGIDIDPALLATATDWALSLDLDVTVLHVRRPNVGEHGISPSPAWQEARHRVMDVLTAAGVRAGALIVDGHGVADEIVGHARTTPTALIAMGCRRHRRQGRGPLDNVVLKTVKHAPCPVLVQSPAVAQDRA